jgi:hypothetical protein
MMSTVGAEGAPDTTAALVLAHSWATGAAGFLRRLGWYQIARNVAALPFRSKHLILRDLSLHHQYVRI